jgi:phosphoglycerate dehydrogenase-like enzyme
MRVLFAGTAFERVKESFLPLFSDMEVQIARDEAFLDTLPWAEVLVTPPREIGEEMLRNAKSLKLIQEWGTGVEGIDLTACARLGIKVCNVPSRGTGNAESVAETALLLMLLLARRYERAQENLLKIGRVHAPKGIALWKKKACVLGLGNLGHCIAERLLCLGMDVVGVNRSARPEFREWGLSSVHPLGDLEEAVKGSRFLVLALPLNSETANIVNRDVLRALGPSGYLINVARGGLVVREDLDKALAEGEIAGAGLDVFWVEPPDPKDPIFRHGNVVAMPHVGGVTDASLEGVARFVRENLGRFVRGEAPLSEIATSWGEEARRP